MATFLVLYQARKRMWIARTAYRCNTDKIIYDKEVCQQFEMRISEAFKLLLQIDDNEVSIENMYNEFKDNTNRIMQDVVGRK